MRGIARGCEVRVKSVCFDLLYMAVVMMYTSQSQLLRFFISSIIDKVRTKAYSLGDAIKVRGGSWEG